MERTITYDFTESTERKRAAEGTRTRERKRATLDGWKAYRAWLKMLRSDFAARRSRD